MLKLSGGDLRRLAAQVDNACADYRDVLGPAEFPRYLQQRPQDMGDGDRRQLIDADWQEYQQWLKA